MPVDEIIRRLVEANRILDRAGIVDVFGHVSVRNPDDPSGFLMARQTSPALVREDDVVRYGPDGDPRDPAAPAGYIERFLHAAIYAARPDVGAVVHGHARAVLPFAVTGAPLVPVCHLGAPLRGPVPLWDSRAEFGDTALLVDDMAKGSSVARTLGEGPAVLLRGHGFVTVGATLEEAVAVAFALVDNATVLLAAHTLGEPRPLTPGEIELAATVQLSAGPLERMWNYWAGREGTPPAGG